MKRGKRFPSCPKLWTSLISIRKIQMNRTGQTTVAIKFKPKDKQLPKGNSNGIGIHKNITFHVARHTFATTVMLSNGVPIETVSKLLGHNKLSTTQIYARVVETKISEDIQNLLIRFKTKKQKAMEVLEG